MSRTTAPLLALLFLSFSAVWVASCGDDASPACTLGDTQICTCLGRARGAQACLADGTYTECDCSSPPREGNGGSTGDTPTTAYVGRACENTSECSAGLQCYTAASNDFFGGGPPGGYCSLACRTDAECAALDPASDCIVPPNDTAGRCVRTCRSLPPQSLAENKCLGRRELACNSVAYLGQEMFSGLRQPGWCFPQCGSDEDCDGRFCDLARGICTDAAVAGAPIGARCEGDLDCAGNLCIRIATDEFFCSAPCVLGQPVGCGYGLAANPRNAGCVLPVVQGAIPGTGGEGDGDVGFCAEFCTEDSDCEQNASRNWACTPSGFATEFNRIGICAGPAPGDAGVDAGGGDDAGPNVQDASVSSDAG